MPFLDQAGKVLDNIFPRTLSLSLISPVSPSASLSPPLPPSISQPLSFLSPISPTAASLSLFPYSRFLPGVHVYSPNYHC